MNIHLIVEYVVVLLLMVKLITYSRWTNYSNPASMSCRLPPVPPQISTLWFPYLCS